jgi:hypothetical protein
MTARLYQFFKWLRINVVAMVLLGLTVTPAFAATLQLYSIGNSVVTGKTFTTFAHTGLNPVFTGSASANTQVNIALNAATNKVTSDDSGAWVFTPTTLVAGVHEVVISSGTETKSFSLTISSASATVTPTITPTRAATASTPTTLPVSGGEDLTWMMVIGGTLMLGLGLMGWSVSATPARVETVEEHD